MFVVVVDFLVPATVLGMVGPVVAKMAVEQAHKAGSAIGDVYFWGAIGSIVGHVPDRLRADVPGADVDDRAPGRARRWRSWRRLLYRGDEPGSIVGIVAAALAGDRVRSSRWSSSVGLGSVDLGSYQINYLAVVGNLAALALGDHGGRADCCVRGRSGGAGGGTLGARPGAAIRLAASRGPA